MKTFKDLELNENLLKAVHQLGFTHPTPVQEQSIPRVMNGEDLIVMSKTGSGKTGAFGLPILQRIEKEHKHPQCLILTPTRELAVQVNSDLRDMGKFMSLSMINVYGQHNINVEIASLEKGAHIVTGTPGRVFDHIKQGTLKTKNIKYLVLDEADRMLDMGFIDQVVRIIKALPKDRVTLLFSATMPPEIKSLCQSYMKTTGVIEIESETKTVDSIEQIYYRVEPNEKRTQIARILTVEHPDSCMVFCNTRIGVDKLTAYLHQKGVFAESLHGANSQSSRTRTIQKFKQGEFQVLVATDVAARGIHVDDLSLVINYDIPVEKDSYVHRIGRTGRAGNGGKAISLVTKDDQMTLYDIEEHVGALIEEMDLPTQEHVDNCRKAYEGKWMHKRIAPEPKPRTHSERPKQRTHADKPKTHGDRPKTNTAHTKPYTEKPKTYNDRPKPYSDKPKTYNDKPRTYNDKPKTYSNDSKPYSEAVRTAPVIEATSQATVTVVKKPEGLGGKIKSIFKRVFGKKSND